MFRASQTVEVYQISCFYEKVNVSPQFWHLLPGLCIKMIWSALSHSLTLHIYSVVPCHCSDTPIFQPLNHLTNAPLVSVIKQKEQQYNIQLPTENQIIGYSPNKLIKWDDLGWEKLVSVLSNQLDVGPVDICGTVEWLESGLSEQWAVPCQFKITRKEITSQNLFTVFLQFILEILRQSVQ